MKLNKISYEIEKYSSELKSGFSLKNSLWLQHGQILKKKNSFEKLFVVYQNFNKSVKSSIFIFIRKVCTLQIFFVKKKLFFWGSHFLGVFTAGIIYKFSIEHFLELKKTYMSF